MLVHLVARLLYVLTGIVLLVAGSSVVLLGTGVLPESVRNIIFAVAGSDPHALHILQEFGSLMVFVGVIALWFAWHYEQSRVFHWAVTLFWALFALVHWFDFNGQFHAEFDPLTTSIPFVLYLVVGLWDVSSRRRERLSTGFHR